LPLVSVLVGFILLQCVVASELESNLSTSVSELTKVGWICAGENTGGVDLNDENFNQIYHYLRARMFQIGLRNEHVVCELGEPALQLAVEDGLWVVGFASAAGESLLVYGDDVSKGSANKNALAVFTMASGMVRQIVWLKTSNQEIEGIRYNVDSRKHENLGGNYTLEKDHVFK